MRGGAGQPGGIFQSLEKSGCVFPTVGKIRGCFSNHWKTAILGWAAALVLGSSCVMREPGISAGDVVVLTVVCPEISGEPQRLELPVDAAGMVTVPVLGEMKAAGMTRADVEAEIRRLAAENNILREPQISLSIRRAATD